MPAAILSPREFQVVWSVLGLGPVPFPLAGSGRERLAVAPARGVFAALAERGLATGGRLHDEWVTCLTVLSRPDRSVDAVGVAGHRLAAVAASMRGVAALAVVDRGSVVLASIREGSLVESVVALLPHVPAGPGHEVAVPVAAVRRFLADPGESGRHGERVADQGALTAAGVGMRDAMLLLDLAEDRRRGGQFGVNVADPITGGLYRCIPVVSWFDTSEGRYLMTNDGSTLAVSPADSAQVAVRLHEILDGHR